MIVDYTVGNQLDHPPLLFEQRMGSTTHARLFSLFVTQSFFSYARRNLVQKSSLSTLL